MIEKKENDKKEASHNTGRSLKKGRKKSKRYIIERFVRKSRSILLSTHNMRRGWTIPALYLATTSQVSFGLISHRLPATTASTSSLLHLTGLMTRPANDNNSYHNSKITRRMSSEVMEDQDFGPTDQSWRSLLEVSIAKSRKIRGSNYVQISTVSKDGTPRCRTVVFRGFLNDNNLPEDHPMSAKNGGNFDGKPCVMKMCTDLRSKKVEEVAHQPISEMVSKNMM